MAYKALYRTYRPSTFDEVVGQKHIIKTLKNAVAEKRVSHAYVFSGLRGIGKTTIARIFAKAVNCELSKDGEPCNVCRNCLSIINNETTDVVELDAASNNGVDQMRDILERVNFLPTSLNKKVYIIDEAHMLSTAAFNALLKTLEEPPSHVIFILATTEPYKIPNTILSRCQRLDFKQLTNNEIIEMLTKVVEEEKINITDEALNGIAEAAEGAMRDALGILDQARVYNFEKISIDDIDSITGKVSYYNLVELISALNEQNISTALEKINSLIDSGKEVSRIISSLIQFCRDLLLYKNLNGEELSQYIFEREEFKQLAYTTTDTRLFYYVDMLVDIQNKIRFTNSPKIYLEVGIIKIVNSATLDIDLINQIQKLEKRIDNIQPEDAPESLSLVLSRMDLMENKVKKITNDFDKVGISTFKDTILSKIDVIENAMLNKTIVDDIQSQIQEINETINYLQDHINNSHENNTNSVEDSHQNINIDNQLNEDIEVIKERINKLDTLILSQTTSVYDDSLIKQQIEELKNKIININQIDLETPNITNYDDTNILEQINSIKEQLAANQLNAPMNDNPIDNERLNNVEEYLDMVINRVDELARMIKNNNISSDNTHPSDELNQLNENYFVILNMVKELKTNLDNVNLEQISTQINTEKESIINYINEQIAQIKNNLNIINEQIIELNEKASESNNSITTDVLNEKVQEINKYIDNVKDYAFKLSSKVQEVQDKVTEINTKLDGGMTKRRSPFEIVRDEEEPTETKPEEPVVETIKPITVDEKPRVISTDKTVVIRNTPVVEETTNDETSRVYDIKIVERILHQAREQQCRNEKNNLLTNWSKLSERAGHLLAPTAKLLSEGTLIANGRAELLIVFPHASICNHLMEPKGHTNALQILKITFGKDYDFIALPENTWQEKRMEYSGQFNMGIIYPKLTPIKNPELKIIVVNNPNLIVRRNQPINQARSFFGDDMVEKEEE